jgi:hypothetical protein
MYKQIGEVNSEMITSKKNSEKEELSSKKLSRGIAKLMPLSKEQIEQ